MLNRLIILEIGLKGFKFSVYIYVFLFSFEEGGGGAYNFCLFT